MSTIFVWYEDGRRRLLGAQSINSERRSLMFLAPLRQTWKANRWVHRDSCCPMCPWSSLLDCKSWCSACVVSGPCQTILARGPVCWNRNKRGSSSTWSSRVARKFGRRCHSSLQPNAGRRRSPLEIGATLWTNTWNMKTKSQVFLSHCNNWTLSIVWKYIGNIVEKVWKIQSLQFV